MVRAFLIYLITIHKKQSNFCILLMRRRRRERRRFSREDLLYEARGAWERLEFREHFLDGIEIGGIRRPIEEGRADGLDGFLDAGRLMAREIVGEEEVAGTQGRAQELIHAGFEHMAPSMTQGAEMASWPSAVMNGGRFAVSLGAEAIGTNLEYFNNDIVHKTASVPRRGRSTEYFQS
jgi:hypothetical protein